MTRSCSLETVKRKHRDLYGEVLRYLTTCSDNAERIRDTQTYAEINQLLDGICELSADVTTYEDYQWLSDAAIQWQMVFSSLLNLPRRIRLCEPRKGLVTPAGGTGALSPEEVSQYIHRVAQVIGYSRVAALGRPSTAEEMGQDWRFAGALFAHDVLDGKINFANRIGCECYSYLQNEWLKYVKCVWAFFHWMNRGRTHDDGARLDDYLRACDHFRELLVNAEMKGQPSEFDPVEAYLRDRYLDNAGRLNDGEPILHMLVARKADRIAGTTHYTDELDNWLAARTYVEMFYENIIPAVRTKSEEHTLVVLKAFQFSKAPEHSYRVISCFEVALAIYFLDPDVVLRLWEESESEPVPASHVRSVVDIASWPKGFAVPGNCRGKFEWNGQRIIFRGVMTTSQRGALLEQLTVAREKEALEKLFRQSRLIHEETTL